MAEDNTIKIEDHKDGTYTVWGDNTTLRESVYCRSKSDLLDYLTKLLNKTTAWQPSAYAQVSQVTKNVMTATGSQVDENAVTKEEEPLKYEPDLRTPQGRVADFFHRHNDYSEHKYRICVHVPVNEYNALRIDFLKLLRAQEMEEDHGHKLSHELADRNEEVTKLQKEKRGLEEIIKIDKKVNSDLQLVNSRLIQELQGLKDNHATTRQEKEDWRKEALELRAKTTKPVHQALMDQEMEIRRLKNELEKACQRTEDFTIFINNHIGSSIDQYLIAGKRVHKDVAEKFDAMKKAKLSFQEDLKQYEQINSDFARTIQEQLAQIEDWKTKHISLSQELDIMKQANENWSKINHEENMEAGRSIEHLSNTIAKKNLFIEGLQKEIANAKKSIDNLTDTLYGKNVQIQNLEKEVKRLRESLNRAMAAVERAKKAVDEYYG